MPFDNERLSLLTSISLVRSRSTFGDEDIDGLNIEEIRLEFLGDDGEGERDRLSSLLPF
ncbi:unnamed protein product, partial [Rotaria sp. Silwood1]